MPINAGRLRHRVTIETRGSGQDSYGQPSGTWSTHATVWAEVMPMSGRELIEGERTVGRAAFRVMIRSLSTVTEGMRVNQDSGRYLNIEAVLRGANEEGEYMELVCSEAT